MNNTIEAKKLTKRFGKNTAVRRLDLTVPTGSIFAFLGPNGAGKTTTIKTLIAMRSWGSPRPRSFGCRR